MLTGHSLLISAGVDAVLFRFSDCFLMLSHKDDAAVYLARPIRSMAVLMNAPRHPSGDLFRPVQSARLPWTGRRHNFHFCCLWSCAPVRTLVGLNCTTETITILTPGRGESFILFDQTGTPGHCRTVPCRESRQPRNRHSLSSRPKSVLARMLAQTA
jgi:hypothetical protein